VARGRLLILSATGLTWSRHAGGNFDDALTVLDAHRPTLSTSLGGGAAPAPVGGHRDAAGASDPAVADPAAADTVLRVARAQGLTGPVELTLPQDTGSAWSVAQRR
jgi:uncharacterized iron-regulated membrane protein